MEMCRLAFLVRMAHAKTCATGAKITLAKNVWVSLCTVIDASFTTNCILSEFCEDNYTLVAGTSAWWRDRRGVAVESANVVQSNCAKRREI